MTADANEAAPSANNAGEGADANPAQPPRADAPVGPSDALQTNITCSRGFPQWLAMHNCSLAFTSYQTGQLFLVGTLPNGAMSLHQRNFVRAMGLIGDSQRLLLAGLAQIWRFENGFRRKFMKWS